MIRQPRVEAAADLRRLRGSLRVRCTYRYLSSGRQSGPRHPPRGAWRDGA
jgi:hypothetical protein